MSRPLVALFLLVTAAVAATGGAAAAPPAPEDDRIGWERGYWHNATIDVGDDPSEREIRAVGRRAMARVEVIRKVEFDADVRIEIVERSSLDEGEGSDAHAGVGDGNRSNASDWNNQVWEALFIVGEDRDISELLQSTTRGSVGGFYQRGDDGGNRNGGGSAEARVTVVTDGDRAIDEATVVHELVHALHDQRFNLSADRFRPPVQDEQLASRGLLEGEANYVQRRYEERCDRDWQCVRQTGSGAGSGSGTTPENMGVFVVLFQPYSDGPPYVHHLVEEGGWSRVDERFEDPPTTSEAILHRRGDDPGEVTVEDRSSAAWERFPQQGRNGSDVAGEASIFATFWYQSHERFGAGLDVIDTASFQRPDAGRFDTYDYTSEPSEGWDGDRITPYRNDDRRGYVWATAWDTHADAREFHAAYVEVLRGHDAERVDDRTWRVPDGRFADAFRVTRRGRNVTITNAPTVEELDGVRRPLPEPGTGDPEEVLAAEGVSEGENATVDGSGRSQPGPGAALAAVAVLLASFLARRRR